MRYNIIIIATFFLFSKCDAQKKEDSIWCKNISQKTIEYIYEFQMSENSLYLDSALVYTNEALGKCNKNKILYSFRKLDILSKKNDYLQAISFLKSLNYPLISELPYFNGYLLNKLQAMEYHYKKEIDSLLVLKNFNEILKNPQWITYTQYFYIKTMLYGYAKTKLEIDSCQNILNGNKEFFKFIDNQCKENDFLDFVGF